MMVELPLSNWSTLGSRIGFPPFRDGAWEPTDSNVAGFEPSSPLYTSALLLAPWVVVAHADGPRRTSSRHTCLGLCCAVKQRWTVAKSWVPWSGLQARSQCGCHRRGRRETKPIRFVSSTPQIAMWREVRQGPAGAPSPRVGHTAHIVRLKGPTWLINIAHFESKTIRDISEGRRDEVNPVHNGQVHGSSNASTNPHDDLSGSFCGHARERRSCAERCGTRTRGVRYSIHNGALLRLSAWIVRCSY